MFWPWSKPALLYISDTCCALRAGANTLSQRTTSLDESLRWCAHALGSGNPTCTVYVGASLLRATVIAASAGARNLSDAHALAQHHLSLNADWCVQCAVLDPRIGTLAVAMPQALLDALRGLAASAGVRQLSVQPAFLSALRAVAKHPQPSATIVAEPGALITLEEHGNQQHLGWQTTADLGQTLPREQARARWAAGEERAVHTWRLAPELLGTHEPNFCMEAA